jgi:hypothetical protein
VYRKGLVASILESFEKGGYENHSAADKQWWGGLMRTAVVLFTRDLRINDHPALAAACANAETVVPLYVTDPALVGRFPSYVVEIRSQKRSGSLARWALRESPSRRTSADTRGDGSGDYKLTAISTGSRFDSSLA